MTSLTQPGEDFCWAGNALASPWCLFVCLFVSNLDWEQSRCCHPWFLCSAPLPLLEIHTSFRGLTALSHFAHSHLLITTGLLSPVFGCCGIPCDCAVTSPVTVLFWGNLLGTGWHPGQAQEPILGDLVENPWSEESLFLPEPVLVPSHNP